MTVAIEPIQDGVHVEFVNDYVPIARYLQHVSGQPIKATLSRDIAREILSARSGNVDLMLGPAHVISSALRYGYEPLAGVPSEARIAIVARGDSQFFALEDLRGRKIGMPSVESLASYVALGELHLRKIVTKDAKTEIVHYRVHDLALFMLTNHSVDAVAVDAEMAKKWAAQNNGRILFESPAMRAYALVVNKNIDPGVRDRLRSALLGGGAPAALRDMGSGVTRFARFSKADYDYVSRLAYLTPSFLPGATLVGADKVQELLRQGATLFDVRTEAEYKTAHIAGARFLPYGEHSKREVGYSREGDKFALTEKVKDKSTPLIFACNGEECWKSYKASVWALAEGYKQVYWFRGGLPEWRVRKFPIENGV